MPQALLERFHATKMEVGAKAVSVLQISYDHLPDHAHCRVFLDAALLLRGQHASHLEALWEGQLLQDDKQGVQPVLLPGRDPDVDASAAQHRQRQLAAAAQISRSMVAKLLDLSVIEMEGDRRLVHSLK